MDGLLLPHRVSTFSICAVNPKTGEAGVAVASRHVAIGALVPYAEPGVGAIATQAVVKAMYGTHGLELLRKKVPAAQAIRHLAAQDITVTTDDQTSIDYFAQENMTREGVDFMRDKANGRINWFTHRIRQIGMVDSQGRAATHDGVCIAPAFASMSGEGFCCQGNMLTGKNVVTSMATAFEQARRESKSMLRCLLGALQAGEAAGGDKRGNKAAALLVVREKGHWSGSDRYCDVRVDEDDQAVAKLTKLTEHYEPN